MTSLVIVESPTKARTIRNFLPKNYKVMASMGHIRDLPQSATEIPEKYKKEPWATLGVNTSKNFEPMYVVSKDKQAVVKELKKAAKEVSELLLATDEDREGESISWHLAEVLKLKIPIKRMVFHEITKSAIAASLKNCREINHSLVKAQETRRILDRLYGYTLSPLLWKKIAAGLSAGRVQSVSVRMIVAREKERRAFRRGSYWDLKALLEKEEKKFEARLVSVNDKKVADGGDFDDQTGKITAGKDVVLLDDKKVKALQKRLDGKDFTVLSVEEKKINRKPSPPFITSTLQQEANRKLKLSPRQTMRIAQSLYERGFITYMRTDSVQLSEQAIKAARKSVSSIYGKEYLSTRIRRFQNKSKGAQEAHEAIRPAGVSFRHPKEADLSGMEAALYDMIWKRTIATQMADARQVSVKALFKVEKAVFRANGKRIEFPGFFRAYVEGSDDPDKLLESREIILPELTPEEAVKCLQMDPLEHETNPPYRYTSASLVKRLEAEGIGRPSTYATIIDTIINRGYARLVSNALVPTFTAFAVTALMEKHFSDLVDTKFTSRMERALDEIAVGETDHLPYIKNFFLGQKGLENKAKLKTESILPLEFRSLELDDLTTKIFIGRYGPYLEFDDPKAKTKNKSEDKSEDKKNDGKIRANIPDNISPADLTQEIVDSIIYESSKEIKPLTIDQKTSLPIYLLRGAYGPYLQLGETNKDKKSKPKRVALPKELKGLKDEEVTPDMAVELLSLPKLLGKHPQSGGDIHAGISRYGSYISHDDPEKGKDFRSFTKTDNILTMTLERALEILSRPKRSRKKSSEPVRSLGKHPEDGSPVNIFVGPYGPYVKHLRVNASIPKASDPEKLTLDEALELLKNKKAGKGRGKRKK